MTDIKKAAALETPCGRTAGHSGRTEGTVAEMKETRRQLYNHYLQIKIEQQRIHIGSIKAC